MSSRSYKKGLALVKELLSEHIESCHHDIEPSNSAWGFSYSPDETEAYFLILY